MLSDVLIGYLNIINALRKDSFTEEIYFSHLILIFINVIQSRTSSTF